MTHYSCGPGFRTLLALLLVPLISLATSAAGVAAADPPGRVARVNFIEGTGSMQSAGVDDWNSDLLNRPLTNGDRVWIDEGSRAEMHVGSTALRLGARTAVQVLAVDDRNVRLSMTAGSINVRLSNFEAGDHFDIETPAGQVSLQQPGNYRLDVDDSNSRAYLAVWNGIAEIIGPSGPRPVSQQQSAELLTGADPAIEPVSANATDSLDQWADARDRSEQQSDAAQYVSRDVVGYQDLDGYGQWVDEPSYGMVWMPAVAAGWAPYHFGYWNWIGPWGWTWIAYEPWGFAPAHYGRWVCTRHGWAWAPGPRNGPRPVYSPALVAWRGERNPDIMHRPKVGWVPLGFNEVYDPPFRASPEYLRASNLANTHLARDEVQRYIEARQRGGAPPAERRYANDYVNGAYADAPRESFASSSFAAPRAAAPPEMFLQPKPAAHQILNSAPVDRPAGHAVGRPVDVARVSVADRPPAQAWSPRRAESVRAPDRPPQQMQQAVRASHMAYVAAPEVNRQAQALVRESEPRPYLQAAERYQAAPPRSAGREVHQAAGRPLR